jgi:hypothetical protein
VTTPRPLSEGNRFQRWYARWAEPHYARMAPELRAQAVLLDNHLYSRRGIGVWLGLLGAIAGTGFGLRGAGVPPWPAFGAATLLWIAIAFALLGAWMMPGRFAGPAVRRKLPLMLLGALAGGLAGFTAAQVARDGHFDLERLLTRLQAALSTLLPAVLGTAAAIMLLVWGLASVRRLVLEHQLERSRLAAERDAAAREAAQAQLQLLQAQIQPHFIFNTLATLQHWVDHGDARAPGLLRALSAFLRASTECLARDAVSLAEEGALVTHYLAIMQARLGERLSFAVEIDAAANRHALPPGLLLTLVENAVEHGIEPALAGGSIEVRAAADGGRLHIDVADTGVGLGPAPAPGGVGLANTRARLTRRYGDAAQLQLRQRPQGGCIASIELPLV